MPTGRVVFNTACSGVDDSESVVAESEGGFDRLGEARLGGGVKVNAVLDDEDFGWEFFN